MAPSKDQPRANGSYSDDSPFVRVLGTQGRVRVLDVFLRKHYTDLTASEVADLAGISKSTFHRNINELLSLGIVRDIRETGGAKHYQLNKENPIAQLLGKLHRELIEHSERVSENTERAAIHSPEEIITEQVKKESKNGARNYSEKEDGQKISKKLAGTLTAA